MSGESELREQLQALVSERPEVPSPAPMVMGQVRRSRRRRRSVGVLAIAAAVAGGVLVGVDRPAAQQGPAAPGASRLCRVELPAGWVHALQPGVYRVTQGQVLAASPDGQVIFLRDGERILQLVGGRETVVLSLPPGHEWRVDGSTEGAWFAFGLRTSSEPDYTRFFLWNTATAKLRQIPLSTSGKPARVLTSWTLGASYLAWETAVSPVPGGMEEQQRQVMRLSDGAVRSLPQLPLFYAGATAYSVTDGRITAADAWTQQPAAVPKALAAAFHMNGTISYRAVDGTFGWGEGNSSATSGPATQNVWDSASATLTEVRASPGDFVRGVDPLGDGYALASFAVKGHQEAAQTWLIDLRSHGYAPLTDQQAGSLSSPDRVIPLTQLSRLPGCGS